jgi:hypothetical protein
MDWIPFQDILLLHSQIPWVTVSRPRAVRALMSPGVKLWATDARKHSVGRTSLSRTSQLAGAHRLICSTYQRPHIYPLSTINNQLYPFANIGGRFADILKYDTIN